VLDLFDLGPMPDLALPTPYRLKVEFPSQEPSDQALRLRIVHDRRSLWGGVLFCFMGAIGVFTAVVILVQSNARRGPMPTPLALLLPLTLVPLLMALFAFYFGLREFVERTHIEVTHKHVRVRHTPLPWPGNRQVAVSNILAVWCSAWRVRHYAYRFEVCIMHRKKRRASVLWVADNERQAYFVQRQLERLLGLKAVRVADVRFGIFWSFMRAFTRRGDRG
jgi:hypothetical protein